jgi:hypothetical protein
VGGPSLRRSATGGEGELCHEPRLSRPGPQRLKGGRRAPDGCRENIGHGGPRPADSIMSRLDGQLVSTRDPDEFFAEAA